MLPAFKAFPKRIRQLTEYQIPYIYTLLKHLFELFFLKSINSLKQTPHLLLPLHNGCFILPIRKNTFFFVDGYTIVPLLGYFQNKETNQRHKIITHWNVYSTTVFCL